MYLKAAATAFRMKMAYATKSTCPSIHSVNCKFMTMATK